MSGSQNTERDTPANDAGGCLEEVRSDDLSFVHMNGGGFEHVSIHDHDDDQTVLLDENAILRLYEYLGRIIREKNLK